MLFFDPLFVFIFLPVTLLGVRLLQHRNHLAMLWLIAASFVFYSYDNPGHTVILVASITANLCFAAAIHRGIAGALAAGVAANLMLLGYFKYAGFLAENLELAGMAVSPSLAFALPLAISFYTFQQIAYLVDLSRGVTGRHGVRDYVLFISFFPHLIAGPIVHHNELVLQFPRIRVTLASLSVGSVVFAVGLLKKLLVADHLSPLVALGHADAAGLSFADAWVTSLAYTFQLYFDFSGYADMAIGLALTVGLLLPVNFGAPYRAASIQDFWRRWHMTLSRWLRDYLFIPLGGSRGGTAATLRNLFLTFLLGGLWHGAAWTFVAWGALHGGAIAVHRLWTAGGFAMPRAAGWLLTFLFVNAAWVFFRAADFADATAILAAMVHLGPAGGASFDGSSYETAAFWLPVAAGIAFLAPTTQTLAARGLLKPNLWTGALVALALFAVCERLIQDEPTPFLYFNF